MNSNKRFGSQSRSGYALIIGLLVVVVLGMFFYFGGTFGPGINADTGEKIKSPPWKQWPKLDRMVKQHKLGKPFPIHPQITETMKISSVLFEGESERGQLELIIDPNYDIMGNWNASYSIGQNKAKEYQVVNCKMTGHFVPYPDKIKVKAPHKNEEIYFLTCGMYTIVEYDNAGGGKVKKINGYIYVTGWLAPDFSVQRGQVFLTSDDKYFKNYIYTGKAEKYEPLDGLFKALQSK
ncbi:MAG: hypothetical protein ABFD79_14195 [Phycisphaerales bacterium]